MARVTTEEIKKKFKTHGDGEVQEIGLRGRVPAEILHELLARHIPRGASDFNFGYIGRGRSQSEVLMLIVTRNDKILKSVIKCGPAKEEKLEISQM